MADGSEQLAIFDAEGRRIGVKTRDEVHRDDDWHELVFVWCAWVDGTGRARLLLQRRARGDDPYAARLDAPAGGHVISTESPLEGACRELAEEVGLDVATDDLVYLGKSKLELDTGGCRRVLQHFFLYPRPVELDDLEFSDEANGLVLAELDGVRQLLDDDAHRLICSARLQSKPEEMVDLEINASSFSYPKPIISVIRLSLDAICMALFESRVDDEIWSRK